MEKILQEMYGIEKFSKKTLYAVYVISDIRYIRFALNPQWVDLLLNGIL